MLAIALGLAAGLSWGVSDFLGGLKSRTLELVAVLVLSQGAALVLVGVVVAARGQSPPPGEELLYAGLAGVSGLIGLAAFYRGLAVGAMAVVAPIAGTGAVIPVVVGLATGERPSVAQGAGIALAIAGVVLASRETPAEGQRARATGVGLALVAAAGFGFFFVGMDAGAESDLLWALLATRGASVACLIVAVAALRPGFAGTRASAGALLAIGVLDVGANGLFAVAASEGLISVAAVLASLYPVITVLLARAVLGERVQQAQRAGIVAAMAGVALISAG